MFTTLRSRLARAAVPMVLITGSLALAHPAAAADFCVGQIACVKPANPMPSLEAALAVAAAAPDADRIMLSGGTFTAPSTGGWVYDNSSGPVEISGAGVGQTILTGPAPLGRLMLLAGAPGTTIRDLSIQLPQMAQLGVGLTTNAKVQRVAVGEALQQPAIQTGVEIFPGGLLTDSSVMMDPAVTTMGVGMALGTVSNSIVSAKDAVVSTVGGTVERSWLTGVDGGLISNGGTTSVENSVIRVNSALGDGLAAFPRFNGPYPVINADGLTVVAGLGGGGTGVHAYTQNAGQTAEINLKNSILRGFTVAAEADGAGGGTATVNTSWSDYDTTTTSTSGNATVSKSNISFVADAKFINPFSGNFRLANSSPLIDAGDPATPQGLDMDGNPRVTDGNLDGTARRDIGAYEVDGPLPVDAPAAASGGDTPPAEQTAIVSDTQPAPGVGASSAPTSDNQGPIISGLKTKNKTFAVGQARTAIAALARGTTLRFSLSEAAKVTIKITPARTGRATGKLIRTGRKGANAIKFSGRIGKRALRPGRYVAVVTAIDATGNRSAAKRVRFRVVRG